MHARRALQALSCLAVASAHGATSPRVHPIPRRPPPPARVAPPSPRPPPPSPLPPLPALPLARVTVHAADVRPGGRLRVHHEGSPTPVRAVLRVGRETWLATPAGVLRFDDRLWRDPAHAHPLGDAGPLPSPDVLALARSPRGPWIGTARGLVTPDHRVHLAGLRVTALAPPLVGTTRGLYRVEAGADVAVPSPVGHVTALLSSSTTLLVGSHDQGLWFRAPDGSFARVRGLPSTRVTALVGDAPVYAATLRGLFVVRDGAASPAHNVHAHVTALAATSDALAVGTFGDGAARVTPAARTALTVTGRVSALAYDDAHGATLVATDDALQVVRAGVAVEVPLDAAPRGRVVALSPDDRTLYAATFAHGLYARGDGRWRAVPGFDPRLSALALTRDHRLWVGTAGGLGTLAPGASTVEPWRDPRGWFARHINALQTEGDTLWVFVHPGAVAVEFSPGAAARYRYLGATDATEFVAPGAAFTKELGALARATVFALARDGGDLWLASADGLLRARDPGLDAVTELGGALADRMVYDVEGRGDGVWALLWRAGLARWTPRGLDVWPVRWQSSPQGLVPFRGGWLVPTDDRGVVRVEARADGVRFTAWGAAQGLAGDAVTAVAVTREGVWLGGLEGIDRVEDGGLSPAQQGGSRR